MRGNHRYSGTLRAIYAHWPPYALAYGGIVLALIVIGLSAERGWIGLIPLSLAVLIVLTYFLFASLWSNHLLYDQGELAPHQALFDLGQINPTDTFIVIDLGRRYQAIDLARNLSTGEVIVVDVYNPQWTASHALARRRSRAPAPPSDPRISWHNGRSDLIPFPDKSVTAVILCQVLSSFWQEGDRQQLLQEINRVLPENGRLLLAERARTHANWLLMGPGAISLQPVNYWRDSITAAGFQLRKEKNRQGIIHCFRADKPAYSEAQQLTLGL